MLVESLKKIIVKKFVKIEIKVWKKKWKEDENLNLKMLENLFKRFSKSLKLFE
jgi:hypothetical protein